MSLIQLPEDADQCLPVTLSFTLHGVLQNLLNNPTCIKMGPPVTTKNWTFHVPYLAVGMYVCMYVLEEGAGQVDGVGG